jgi:hypothetical protein
MVKIICSNCRIEFERCLSKIDRAKNHYCSKECRFKGQESIKRNSWIENDIIHLETTKNIIAKFDLIDKDLEEMNWYSLNGYIIRRDKSRNYIHMHNVIMDRSLRSTLNENEEVDHINGVRSDNRRNNLRFRTHSENCANTKKPNRANKRSTARYKGVSFNESRKMWRVRITIKGFTHHLGYFEDEREAAKAYDKAAIYYFGDNAKLNFEKEKYAWEIHEQAGSAIRAKA